MDRFLDRRLGYALIRGCGLTKPNTVNVYTMFCLFRFQLITADGSPVTLPDQNATNGVIHVVSRVMFPIPLMNIPEEVTRDPRFSTLLTAVEKANLATVLAGKSIFSLCKHAHVIYRHFFSCKN